MSRLPRSVRRWLRQSARWMLAAVCTLAVFSGAARAGSRYFFCNVMEQERSSPCCQHSPAPTEEVDAADCPCCQVRHAPAVPAALRSPGGGVGPAPLAVLPAAPFLVTQRTDIRVRSWAKRPGVGPPRPPDPARLMVFLT